MRFLTGLCLLLLTSLCTSVRAQCPNLVWSDEFDAAELNEADWNYQIGDGCDIGICRWGNNEAQFYQRENVTLEDGILKITAIQESIGDSPYSSARITTKGKQDFRFGYLEARIKLPAGGGLWPAFWMLSTDEEYGGWPRSGEIDIMEWVGNSPKELLGTIHFGQDFPNNSQSGSVLEQRLADFSDDYHTYAIDWTTDRIIWSVDGYVYGSKNRSNVAPEQWPFDKDFHFLLNLAVGGTLGGAIDNSFFPATMEVDYVRVYDAAPATLAGDRNVLQGEEASYTLNNLPSDAVVTWTGPDGAVITPGISAASVLWNGTGGVLVANITTVCGDYTVSTEVTVGPSNSTEYSFENFDDEALAIYEFSTGALTEIDNPAPNTVNSSIKVGQYIRDAGSQFDVVVYRVNTIENANDYVSGDRSFTMDVNTMAFPGKEIVLQMETSDAEGDNYPVGRHSRYRALTTIQGEWERLTFTLLDQPDGAASPTGIEKLILLLDPNNLNNDTYLYDNLDSNAPDPNGVFNVAQLDFPLTASPNPASEMVQLRFELPTSGPLNISLFNTAGEQVKSLDFDVPRGENVAQMDLNSLPAGVYFVRLRLKEGIRTIRLVKQ